MLVAPSILRDLTSGKTTAAIICAGLWQGPPAKRQAPYLHLAAPYDALLHIEGQLEVVERLDLKLDVL